MQIASRRTRFKISIALIQAMGKRVRNSIHPTWTTRSRRFQRILVSTAIVNHDTMQSRDDVSIFKPAHTSSTLESSRKKSNIFEPIILLDDKGGSSNGGREIDIPKEVLVCCTGRSNDDVGCNIGRQRELWMKWSPTGGKFIPWLTLSNGLCGTERSSEWGSRESCCIRKSTPRLRSGNARRGSFVSKRHTYICVVRVIRRRMVRTWKKLFTINK